MVQSDIDMKDQQIEQTKEQNKMNQNRNWYENILWYTHYLWMSHRDWKCQSSQRYVIDCIKSC